MAKYTQDWFSEAEGIFDFYLSGFKGLDNLSFCEIGTFEGRSTIWLLDNILTGKNCNIVCVDTFEGSDSLNALRIDVHGAEKRLLDNLEPYRGRYSILKGKSQLVLRKPEFIDKFDIIYIDGSHEGSDTLEDMVIAYRNLKVGGLMINDDYTWKHNYMPAQNTPKLAIDSFLGCFKGKVDLVEVTHKTVILKRIL
jgi:predicted O-methyltransferase YrrM